MFSKERRRVTRPTAHLQTSACFFSPHRVSVTVRRATGGVHTSRSGARSLRTCPCISGRPLRRQTRALRSSGVRAHERDYDGLYTLITLNHNRAHSWGKVCHTARIKNGRRHLRGGRAEEPTHRIKDLDDLTLFSVTMHPPHPPPAHL